MDFNVTIIGYFAGFCTALAQFPQAYKVFKTKETASISLIMYSIMTFGILLWFSYGLALNDWPMILSNGICLLPSLYTLYVTIQNSREKPDKAE